MFHVQHLITTSNLLQTNEMTSHFSNAQQTRVALVVFRDRCKSLGLFPSHLGVYSRCPCALTKQTPSARVCLPTHITSPEPPLSNSLSLSLSLNGTQH